MSTAGRRRTGPAAGSRRARPRPAREHAVRRARAALARARPPAGALPAARRRPARRATSTFRFAERVGVGDYLWLYSDDVPYTAFAGDWLFTRGPVRRATATPDAAYVEDVLRRTWQLDDGELARLLAHAGARWSRSSTHVLSADRLGALHAGRLHVGLPAEHRVARARAPRQGARTRTSRSRSAARTGRRRWASRSTAQFPFVDLAFSGEADQSFPAVLAARRSGAGSTASPASASRRRPTAARHRRPPRAIDDLDGLPVPDFEPFFEQRHGEPGAAAVVTRLLLVETARGCWWGERSHCTFCGLNGATMAFRSKTPDRVVDEISALRERYGVAVVQRRRRHPRHALLHARCCRCSPRRGSALEFFWEVKANLTRRAGAPAARRRRRASSSRGSRASATTCWS